MGMPVSGKINERSAPFQEVFTNPSTTVDLTARKLNAKYAASGLVVKATGNTTFNWKDCAGTACALPLVNGDVIHLPFAVTTLEASLTVIVIAYWNAGTGSA